MSSVRKHTVSMSCLAPAGQFMELVGDFPDWQHPIAMSEVAPGDYQCSVALLPGVYRYKFRLNQRLWLTDPRASLVDASNPFENAVLVIGGIEWPFLFAPDRRHVALDRHGHLTVQIELPRPVESPIDLIVDAPPHGERIARFFEVASQRGVRLLRADLRWPALTHPQTRARLSFSTTVGTSFEVPRLAETDRPTTDIAAPRRAFVPAAIRRSPAPPVSRPETDRNAGAARNAGMSAGAGEGCRAPVERLSRFDEAPDWLGSAVFYSVLIDRWHRGGQSPALPWANTRTTPSGPGIFYGGDFAGLCEHLDHLVRLGVNGLVLSPVHPSPSPLRRAATNLLSVDAALGGEEGLGRLLDSAHARGLKVVVEAAVTHLSARHPLFTRLLRDQANSDYADWFQVRRFPVSERDASSYAHLSGHPECPALDLTREAPRRHVTRALNGLVKRGIDGILLHGLSEAPADLWRHLRQRLRRLNPNLLFWGQVESDNLATLAGAAGVDAVHDPRHRASLLDFFGSESIDADEFCRRVTFDEARLGPLPPSFFVQALDTLDTPRFLSAALLQARLRLALTWLFLRPGPISITYGTELGASFLDAALAARNAWRDRPPMPGLNGDLTLTGQLIARLASIRRELRPLQDGVFAARAFAERGLWIERRCGAQIVRAYLNVGRFPIAMPLPPEGALPLLDVNVPQGVPADVLPADAARLFAAGLPLPTCADI